MNGRPGKSVQRTAGRSENRLILGPQKAHVLEFAGGREAGKLGMLSRVPRTKARSEQRTGASPGQASKADPTPVRQRSLLDDLLALLETGDDIARVARFCVPTFLVSHPDGVRHVLRDNAGNYRKGAFFRSIALLQGQGLLTSEGESWQRQRRVAQPAFRQEGQGRVYGLVMAEEAQGIVSGWQSFVRSGEPLNVVAWMHRLTFRIAARTLLGVGPDELDDLGRQLQDVGGRLRPFLASGTAGTWPPARWLPVEMRRRFRHAIADYHAIAQRLIDERQAAGRGEPGQAPNLLDLLLAAHGNRSGKARQLRDQVITFIGAGVETTAQALSWAWYLLARHAQCGNILRAELDAELSGSVPQAVDLPRLSYTRMVVDEVLRLYPPAAVIPRQANAVDNIAGFRVPRNARLLVSPYVTHRRPDFWPQPERFRPERFSPGEEASRHGFQYLPFGAGPRTCIGRQFALTEIQLALAALAQRYSLRLLPGRCVVPEMTTTLGPRGGLWMTVHERG